MSVQLPSRGVLRTASSRLRSSPSAATPRSTGLQSPSLFTSHPHTSLPITQRRTAFWSNLFRKKKKESDSRKALKEELKGNRQNALMANLQPPTLVHGSIFSEQLKEIGLDDKAQSIKPRSSLTRLGGSALQDALRRAVDPDPRSRVRWQRKVLIQRVRRNLDPYGREPKAEWLARTERRILHKSVHLPTSHKKLGHLARQIAGKTVEDALVQMQFSVKQQARNVRWHLEEARDLAIVRHGMGLGNVLGKARAPSKVNIVTKDGKQMEIRDPTSLYIEQAWVGKGPKRFQRLKYRARGRREILNSPSTSLSVVIKEEKTRIREHKERLTKEKRRAPWIHLPDRPITSQRPYYSW